MNNQRRKRIYHSIYNLRQAQKDLTEILDTQNLLIKKMPESEEDSIATLEEVVGYLEETISNIEMAITTLDCTEFKLT